MPSDLSTKHHRAKHYDASKTTNTESDPFRKLNYFMVHEMEKEEQIHAGFGTTMQTTLR